MSTLHTVNKSPFGNGSLLSCLKHCKPGDGVVFIEDGVYGALAGSGLAATVRDSAGEVSIYVLDGDAKARGLEAGKLIGDVTPIGYDGFVDLVAAHDRTLAWL